MAMPSLMPLTWCCVTGDIGGGVRKGEGGRNLFTLLISTLEGGGSRKSESRINKYEYLY